MKILPLSSLTRVLRGAVVVLGPLYIVLYVLIALRRLRYPFELEWMEGAAVDHVRRILSGQKLYGPPSLSFVPFIYTPLYFYLAAGVARVIGLGFLALRLVSFVASLGCFALIFLLVRRETGQRVPAVLAVALFAATYRMGGAWFDLGRVDMVFLLLCLGAILLLRFRPTVGGCAAAGVLAALAFLTKQTALPLLAPVFGWALWRHRGPAAIGTMLAGTLVVGSVLWLDQVHGGWFRYYVFTLPAHHGSETGRYIGYWSRDLLSPLAPALVGGVLWLLYRAQQADEGTRERVIFHALLAVGLIGSSWFSRVHRGGYDNVLIPGYAGVSILFGLAVDGAQRAVAREETNRAALWLVCLMQFVRLLYNPMQQVPSTADVRAGERLLAVIQQAPGEVLLPDHGYLACLAGKESFAQGMAVDDVMRSADPRGKAKLRQEIHEALAGKRFAAIITDASSFLPRAQPAREGRGAMGVITEDDNYVSEELERYYERGGDISIDKDAFWPVTGKVTRPQWIYVPRP